MRIRKTQAPKECRISRRLLATLTGFLAVMCISAQVALAQDVDPSKCFQDMLVSHYNFSQRENLLLSALAIVNSDNYKEAGKNESLTGAYAGFSLTGKYEDFEKERNQLFEYNKLDINQYKQILVSSSWVGDR